MIENLYEIGKKFTTDKHIHMFNGISYLDNYEFHFEKLRDKKINLLEIGVLQGKSLRTWKEYFYNDSQIFGLDVDPSRKFEEERIRIDIGSQNDTEFLKETYKDVKFDIIVDDGSHVNEFTLNSFNQLFYNNLNPGGIYVIEDLLCSYEPASKSNWPGMRYNKEQDDNGVYINDRKIMDDFFNKIIHDLDNRVGEIQSIHFYSMMSFIYKKK